MVSRALAENCRTTGELTKALARYQARLAARPLLTQSVTTLVLFATGDITAQQLVEKRGLAKHDVTRTGRMALYGGGAFGTPLSRFAEEMSRCQLITDTVL